MLLWWPHHKGGPAPELVFCSFIPVGTPWSPSLWKLGRAAGGDSVHGLCFPALGEVCPMQSITWWVQSGGEPVLSVTCGGGRQKDGEVRSFASSGTELTSLADNPVWFYLVRLLVLWCLKVVL